MEDKSISIIIPIYNAESTLKRCIDSRNALNETNMWKGKVDAGLACRADEGKARCDRATESEESDAL